MKSLTQRHFDVYYRHAGKPSLSEPELNAELSRIETIEGNSKTVSEHWHADPTCSETLAKGAARAVRLPF